MLEPIQAEGGVNVPGEGFLKAVREFCDEKGILLIFDEVQTGIGRVGTLFAYQLYGVEPDIMSLAKGLGGGIPIGAVLAKENAAVFTLGDHNATFGGNPVTSATAYATLKYVVENDIPGNARKVGQYLKQGLEKLKGKYDFITEVRGEGLLLAMEFDKDISADVVDRCIENGMLINKLKTNAIRFIPPLVMTTEEADEALGILDRVLVKMS
jgi:acetylornithine/succinyldiaminopimelate/putrescine aminotransferase